MRSIANHSTRREPRTFARIAIVVACTLTLATAAAATAEAEEPRKLTLAECVRRAQELSPLVAAASHEVDGARAAADAMSGHIYPTVGALLLAGPTPAAHGDAVESRTPVNDYDYLISNLGPFFRAEVTLTQPLWTFGKVSHGRDALDELVRVQEARVRVAQWEVATQVKAVYYGYLLALELSSLVSEIDDKLGTANSYLEEHLASADSDVAPVDRLKLKTYAAEVAAQRVELKKQLAVLADALVRLIGERPPFAFTLADEGLDMATVREVSETSLVEEALDRDPTLSAADHGVRALEAKRAAYAARYYPDLFLAGRVRYGVAPNRDQQTSPFAKDDFNFFDAGIGVGLRYEWDTGVVGPEVRQVEAELASLIDKRAALAERIRHDVTAAYAEYLASKEKVGAARDGFKAGRAWGAFAYDGFELGTVNAKDLIDGLTAFVKARFTLLQALYEHNRAVAELSRVVGLELQPEVLVAGANAGGKP